MKPYKRGDPLAVLGMSGVGKTRIASMLRAEERWFHYSVDYRIGTRYMDEAIEDNFKREAMKAPLLRELLLSDSIYISSNITFDNLEPLSTYLGKPGDPAKGGIPFDEYVRRQRQHREAEIRAMLDTPLFIEKAKVIYGYDKFICDTSGSICEVVNPDDEEDPVLKAVSNSCLIIYIAGDEAHKEALKARFDRAPKPMYYNESFLRQVWADYLKAGIGIGLAENLRKFRFGLRIVFEFKTEKHSIYFFDIIDFLLVIRSPKVSVDKPSVVLIVL